jgi:hypothetical protein
LLFAPAWAFLTLRLAALICFSLAIMEGFLPGAAI